MVFESSRPNLTALLTQVAEGEASARDELLALYRPYLRLVAGQRMPRLVQKRVDASDLVQQTLIDAVRGLPEFRGQTEPEFTAWMMRLLERNLLMSVRNNTLGKRDIRLEQDLSNTDGSAQMMWHLVSDDASSPVSRVVRGEAALQLAAALDELPPDQRCAVEMRYIGHRSLQEIADEMQRSVGSVAGLIRRGVATLQDRLPPELGDLST
jgi:RNA polymerase sigma-70 factor (ECF subfamily)